MPKDTFHNLPDDKRRRFVDAAMTTFASAPYDQASITSLTKAIGIAKGSFYQYFEDKFELYVWLLSEIASRKTQLAAENMGADGDLWERLQELYAAGLVLWREQPRLAAIVLHLDQPSREPRLEALRKQRVRSATDWIRAQLEAGVREGSVRPDLDLGVATWLVHATLSDGLLRAFLDAAGVGIEELVNRPQALQRLSDADLERVVTQALRYVRAGVGTASPWRSDARDGDG